MEYLITFLTSTITGTITFVLGRQKTRKELESMHLENLDKTIDIYQTIISDLRIQMEQLNARIVKMEKKIDDLMKENHELKKLLQDLNADT